MEKCTQILMGLRELFHKVVSEETESEEQTERVTAPFLRRQFLHEMNKNSGTYRPKLV